MKRIHETIFVFILAIALGSLLFVLAAHHRNATPERVAPQHFWTDQVRTPPRVQNARTLGHLTLCGGRMAESADLGRLLPRLAPFNPSTETLVALSMPLGDNCYEDWVFAVREDRLVPPK